MRRRSRVQLTLSHSNYIFCVQHIIFVSTRLAIHTPNFRNLKFSALQKADKSSKAAIDPRIESLCSSINEVASLCTLSSCSGRVFMHTTFPKKATHTLQRFFESHDLLDLAAFGKTSDVGPTVWLRFEPAILHVACADVKVAQRLLRTSAATFPVSGILTVTGIDESEDNEARKIVVSLRQDGAIDMPVRVQDRDLFDQTTGEYMVNEVARRFRECWSRIDVLEQNMKNLSCNIFYSNQQHGKQQNIRRVICTGGEYGGIPKPH